MFHVMLVLPVLIAAAVVISIVLLGILTFVAGIVGGASTALLIKNKAVKRLLFVGFCILSFVGMACVIPGIVVYAGLTELVLTLSLVGIFVCIGILAIVGVKATNVLQSKVANTILKVVFVVVIVGAISAAATIPIVRWLLLSL